MFITIFITGIAIFVNFILMLQKLEKRYYYSLLIDVIALALTTIIFGGAWSAMASGFIGNMLFSIYLLFKPLNIDIDEPEEWIKKRD